MSTILLLAQSMDPGVSPSAMPQGLMIVLIVAAVMAVPITAIITGVKYATKERELAHAERMKALEKGIDLDDIEEDRRFRKGIMRLSAGIGVAVPICAIGAATGAVIAIGGEAAAFTVFLIWSGAGAVGVAGAASGAWLAQAAIARFGPARRESQGLSPYRRSSPAETAAAG